ncbi:hypothetical protein HD554DRAFT_2036025 [Boletus coccyginus]|nr:hypothetical protein HD554DRAFT_2036025 [Boletus coccyginus]
MPITTVAHVSDLYLFLPAFLFCAIHYQSHLQAVMSTEWTTPEQKAFLLEEPITFNGLMTNIISSTGRLFARNDYKGIPDDSILTEQQKETLVTTVLKCQKQLCAWIH